MAVISKLPEGGDIKESLKIVTFADGTDEEISKMLDAHYAGKIDISDYWSIGDTRKIHLNEMTAPDPNSSSSWASQDITIVICDFGGNLKLSNEDKNPAIVCQTREVLNNSGSVYNTVNQIYPTGKQESISTFTKWSQMYMKNYLTETVYDAFPASMKSMIKTVVNNRMTTYNSNTFEGVSEKIFLPSYPQVFGNVQYSYYMGGANPSSIEGYQWEYYKTASNILKYGNNNGESNDSVQFWWLSSPASYYSSSTGYCWCYADYTGVINWNVGSISFALAPAFCL